jgi:hypothetical protein
MVRGSLPSGLSLGDSTGLISGVPSRAGTYQFTVKASKLMLTRILSEEKTYTLVVQEMPILGIYPDFLPDATEGVEYDVSLRVIGGSPPYVWSVTGLPSPLTYAATPQGESIRISGVPATGSHGSYSLRVNVRETSTGASSSRTYSLAIRVMPWAFRVELTRLTPEGSANNAVVYLDNLVVGGSFVAEETHIFQVVVTRVSGMGNKAVNLQVPHTPETGLGYSLGTESGSFGDSSFATTITIRVDNTYAHLREERTIETAVTTRVTDAGDEETPFLVTLKGIDIDMEMISAQPVQAVYSSEDHKIPMVENKLTIFKAAIAITCSRVPNMDLRFRVALRLPVDGSWDFSGAETLSEGEPTSGDWLFARVWVTISRAEMTPTGIVTAPTFCPGRFVRDVSLPGLNIAASALPKPKLIQTGTQTVTSSYAMFSIAVDSTNRILEADEYNNEIDVWWPVKRTRNLRLLFIPWAKTARENSTVWGLTPPIYPTVVPATYDDYLYYSEFVDTNGDGSLENIGLFGEGTPNVLVVYPGVTEFRDTLRIKAQTMSDYVLATYPIADIHSHVDAHEILVGQDPDTILWQVARRVAVARGLGYDAGVAFRMCGYGGQFRGAKWAVSVDVFGHDVTLAHELYHMQGYAGDFYKQASPGYWVSKREERGIGESWFMDAVGFDLPSTLLGGTNDASLSTPPYFVFAAQSNHWVRQDMYENMMNGWFALDTSRDPEGVLVGGAIFRNGSAYFDPFIVQNVEYVDLLPNSSGGYHIVFLDAQNRVLSGYGFNASFAVFDDPTRATTDASYFQYYVEMDDRVKKVELKDAAGRVLASRNLSPNPPTITLDFPVGGEKLSTLRGQPYVISWKANDADGDKLYYYVAVSADNGTNWIPLGVDLTDTKFVLKTRYLDPSERYIINVKVSDGFNTRDVYSKTFAVGYLEERTPGMIETIEENSLLIMATLILMIIVLAVLLMRTRGRPSWP